MGRTIAIVLVLAWNASCLAANEPNIVFVFTDDQGWADTSVQMMPGRAESKSDEYRTPALERMARAGMVFSNAYACAPTCTPSRAGIQFGKTPCRLRQTVVHDILATERGIDCQDEISIAQMIKRANPNYVTGHFGKWGFHPRSPEHAGYDNSDGNTNNGEGDYLDVKQRTRLPSDDPKRIFSVTQIATKFMEEQVSNDRPFFLQVSHYAVHAGHAARDATTARYRKETHAPTGDQKKLRESDSKKNDSIATYAAMIDDLDTALESLLDKIESLGIANNTYVIFTSDNGGGFRGNGPLRGGKAQLWEGGIRVPTVVVGPSVRRGETCDVPIAGWDFYATINDLVGGNALPREFDGGSLRRLFEDGNDGTIERGTNELIFHFPWYGGTLPMSAIRDGEFKLVMNLHTREVQLYNLAEDLSEKVNIAETMPDKAGHLRGRLIAYLEAVEAETLDDMFDARIRELNRYLERERQRPTPNTEAIARHTKALGEVLRARMDKEWR